MSILAVVLGLVMAFRGHNQRRAQMRAAAVQQPQPPQWRHGNLLSDVVATSSVTSWQPPQWRHGNLLSDVVATSSVTSWQPPQWRHVNLLSDVMATSSVTSWQPPQWRLGNLTLCNMTSISTRHFIKFDVICNFDLAFRHHYIVEITGGFFILLL